MDWTKKVGRKQVGRKLGSQFRLYDGYKSFYLFILYLDSGFSKNKNLDDSLVTKFIFSKTKTQFTCNSPYCSSYMLQTKCRKYLSCYYSMCIIYILRSKYGHIVSK